MSVKINKLEIENVKRVRAVKMEPSANGLTIIGGDNGQGKTSVLDSIAWALGGDKFRPSQPVREGSAIAPYLHIVLSNGLVVERRGKNSDLKVTDPSGERAGQQLLNKFVEAFALDLPRFMEANDSDKAKTLLNIIGVGPQLAELDRKEKEIYNERLAVGRIADQKKKFADEQQYFPDAPKDIVSASELIRQQQEILAKNGENQRKRDKAREIQQEYNRQYGLVKSLEAELSEARTKLSTLEEDLSVANKTAENLQDESTAELERNLAEIEEINRKVRVNLDKDKAEEDALIYKNQYDGLTADLEKVRDDKKSLLDHAELPLPGLSVRDGKLIYNGQEWDNMSGSDQLIVATAIVRKLNPDCGFVLIDKLEQMDLKTLQRFGGWLEQEGLQAIATRVSTGDECSIIIEDGYAVKNKTLQNTQQIEENAAKSAAPAFTPGTF